MDIIGEERRKSRRKKGGREDMEEGKEEKTGERKTWRKKRGVRI